MKKICFLPLLIILAGACSGDSHDEESGGKDSLASVNQAAKARNSDADTSAMKIGTEPSGGEAGSNLGKDLINQSDCNTCHKTNDKLIGPAFKDVAAKYPASEANIDLLARKVISGGKGNWGDIAMTPHPLVAEEDARQMVKYVLSLKK